MDAKHPATKISTNLLSMVFGDNHSVGSAKSSRPLLVSLFIENAASKVAASIGETKLSGEFPLCDKYCHIFSIVMQITACVTSRGHGSTQVY